MGTTGSHAFGDRVRPANKGAVVDELGILVLQVVVVQLKDKLGNYGFALKGYIPPNYPDKPI